MASIFQEAKLSGFASYIPAAAGNTLERYAQIYEEHRHRIFSLAFYMTDSEIQAEELLKNVFCRAFAQNSEPSAELIDRALIAELRELAPLGIVTLEVAPAAEVVSARRNVKRVLLERAVISLPVTERFIYLMHDVENYDYSAIGKLIGASEDEIRHGLHMARLAVRQWLSRNRG